MLRQGSRTRIAIPVQAAAGRGFVARLRRWAAAAAVVMLAGLPGCAEDTCGELGKRLCRDLDRTQCSKVDGFLDQELGELPSAVKRHACREILKKRGNVERWVSKAKVAP